VLAGKLLGDFYGQKGSKFGNYVAERIAGVVRQLR
jgi:hypothetical protein